MDGGPTLCRQCGETLQVPVGFCPFCGMRQRPVAAEPPVPPTPVPPEPVRPVAAAPAPPVPPPPPVPPQPPRRPVVPPVSPAAPAARSSTAFPAATPRRTVWNRPRATSAATRAARAASIRKLLLAAIILTCAAVLWHHLTNGPHGILRVHLRRPADGAVLVDGAPAGSPEQPISLEPGRHTIGFAAQGWSTAAVTINLRDGETRRLELSPVPHHAALTLDTTPAQAWLSLDGRRIGRAPMTLSLPPGPYRVAAGLPGYQPEEQRIVLPPGEQRGLTLALRPVPFRSLHVEAPAGTWSDPVTLPAGCGFTLLFRAPVRVRAGGHVVLLEGGAPADLGRLDGASLSFTAAGNDPVRVDVLVHVVGTPG